jgi:hypothetical protein
MTSGQRWRNAGSSWANRFAAKALTLRGPCGTDVDVLTWATASSSALRSPTQRSAGPVGVSATSRVFTIITVTTSRWSVDGRLKWWQAPEFVVGEGGTPAGSQKCERVGGW